jgi:hypothetical protein
MSARQSLIGSAALILTASLLGGCASYDYLQRTDRIGYHAGDAVKANLERETINPSSGAMYDTTGLGKNGSVIPADSADSGSGGSQAPAAATDEQPPTPQ